jgi:hypothetical protein
LISKLADDEFRINHIISVFTYKKADSNGISKLADDEIRIKHELTVSTYKKADSIGISLNV